MSKEYRLRDFNPQDIEKIKKYLETVFIGWISVVAEEKIEEFIEEMQDTPFTGDDTFHLNLTMHILGNDLLAAIGVAQNERPIK